MGKSQTSVRRSRVGQRPKTAPQPSGQTSDDDLRAIAHIMEILREGGYDCELEQEIDPRTD
jgi:hypothetical protein